MDLNDLFKDLVWDNLIKAALGKLFAAVPVLGWGPIGLVVNYIVFKFADQLYDAIKEWKDFKVIFLRNLGLEQDFNTTSVKLKLIAIDKGKESVEYKEARNENQKRLQNLVRFNPAS